MAELVINSRFKTDAAIRRVQWFTVVWMVIEVAIALLAAIRAHSVALAAFGGDSAIELLSAGTVLWRFSTTGCQAEKSATRITKWLLIALAAYIATNSLYVLLSSQRAELSRHRASRGCSPSDAVARPKEAKVGCSGEQCRLAGRCCTKLDLRVSCMGRISGIAPEYIWAYLVGGSCCGVGRPAHHY